MKKTAASLRSSTAVRAPASPSARSARASVVRQAAAEDGVESSRFALLFNADAKGGKKAKEHDDDEERDEAGKLVKKDGESDDDYAKRCEDDEEASAEEETDDPDAEKEDEDKDKEAAAYARGVQAERARWDAVLTSEAAIGRGPLACSFLADTDLTAPQLIKAIALAPAGKGATGGLAARMAAARIPAPSPGNEEPAASSPNATVQAILAARAKADGTATTPARR